RSTWLAVVAAAAGAIPGYCASAAEIPSATIVSRCATTTTRSITRPPFRADEMSGPSFVRQDLLAGPPRRVPRVRAGPGAGWADLGPAVERSRCPDARSGPVPPPDRPDP